MRVLRRHLVAPLVAALGLLVALSSAPSSLHAESSVDKPLPIKLLKQQVWNQKAKARLAERALLWKKYGKKKGGVPAGLTAKRYVPERLSEADVQGRAARTARAREIFEAQALSTNVRANNPASDVNAAQAGQSEGSIGIWGNYVLVAWNDGDGFDRAAPNDDIFGYAYSVDGGQTFTDGGTPPKRTNWTWTSDPVISVNEKTGTFYVCGLIDSTLLYSGIGVISGSFSGAAFNWGTPVRPRLVQSNVGFIDKPWIAADSSSDSVYVTYVNFLPATGAEIQFQRSANGSTWPATATKLSSTAANGLVQGPRVAPGPNGEVYCAWAEISLTTNFDNFRVKSSLTQGSTFGSQQTISSYYDNFGTGPPGFNRRRGIGFPSIAVDRTSGANRGRVYATWNESLDYYDELGTPTVGNISEALVENHTNDTPASAQLIAMGNMVRGKFIDVNDFDYFKFNGTAGQTIVCYLDSLDSAAYISFRLICSDGVTFMGASGLGTGSQCFLVFTLPSNGQYYLRLADINGTTGGYRFRTQLNVLGPERGRDCRDIFVSSSTNISSWSTPVRVNQDDALYDNWLPEVIVDGKNGRPYVAWLDWRDTPGANCGGFSHVYLARSDNGGAAWTEVGIITTAQSNWTNELGNLIPNQGDYIALAADSAHIGACWSDARDGNANVYTSLMTILVTPVAASLVSADAQPDRVLLRWFAAGSEGGLAAVQRRDADVFASADAGWVTLADVPVGGNGLVIYEDASVVAGRTYEYRLGLDDGGTQGFAGLARVSIPLRPSLSIAGITPNPVRNEMLVEFALPNADPARLNVYDISGRLVRTREVSFGPGRHRTSLDARSLGAGVYLVEVTQAGHRATTRASVVR